MCLKEKGVAKAKGKDVIVFESRTKSAKAKGKDVSARTYESASKLLCSLFFPLHLSQSVTTNGDVSAWTYFNLLQN
jgi:hypothetical protein